MPLKSILQLLIRRDRGVVRRRMSPGIGDRSPQHVECLETRALLATFTVTNLNDSGAGSLRQAVEDANNAAGADTIDLTGVTGTITLTSGELRVTEGVTINGPGANELTVSGGNNSRIFNLGGIGQNSYTIQDLDLANGAAGGSEGGAIRLNDSDDVIDLNRLLIRENSANGGGAVFLGGVEYSLLDSTLVDNVANFAGGAILTQGSANGWILNSTFGFNTAGAGFGTVQQEARAGQTSVMRLRNTTVADSTGDAVLNYAESGGTATVEISNSILARSSGANVRNSPLGTGVANVNSIGSNISDDGSSVFDASGDLPNTDPLLPQFPLRNGGPTPTYQLSAGSPAIDRGNAALAIDGFGNPYTEDQRGAPFGRIYDGNGNGVSTIDIGAVEYYGDLFVSTNTDVVDSDNSFGQFSLREAIAVAEAQPGPDSIIFDASMNGQTITLGGSELRVMESLTINGPASGDLTISGGGASTVLWLGSQSEAASYELRNLTIKDGNGSNSSRSSGFGGGILFFDEFGLGGSDSLGLFSTVVTENTADLGGGIYSVTGTLNLTSSIISLNTATGTTDTRGGGGLAMQSTITTLAKTTVIQNTAAGTGGGVYAFTFSGAPNEGDSSLTISGGSISNNSASAGGGVFNQNQNTGEQAVLSLTGTTVANNSASAEGGGIWNNSSLQILESTIDQNSAGAFGGGILQTDEGAVAVLRRSTISRNSAMTVGGGFVNRGGRADLVDSLVQDNTAVTGGNATQIANRNGILTLSNVTVNDEFPHTSTNPPLAVDNVAENGETAEMYITNSTFVGQAGVTGIQSFAFTGGTAISGYGNSLFASWDNSVTANGPGTLDALSSGFNIFEDTPTGHTDTSDLINTNPLVGFLQDNGGPTLTRTLQAGSPAIDAGDNTQALELTDLNGGTVLNFDQRGSGFDRIVDNDGNGTATVDIGAVEQQAFRVLSPVGRTTDQTPIIQWSPVAGAQSYDLWVNIDDGGGNVFQQLGIDAATTSFQLPSNLEFARYRVFVYANMVGGSQQTAQGHTFVVDVQADLNPVGATTASRPTFDWTRVAGASEYILYINRPGSPITETVADPGSGSTVSHTISQSLPANDLRWWVRPVRDSGWLGPWSDFNEFYTAGRTKVTSPARNATITDPIPTLQWPAVPGAASYEVYMSIAGTSGAIFRDAGMTSSSYQSRPLANGVHTVWVRTTLSDGSSVWGSGHRFIVNAANNGLVSVPQTPVGSGLVSRPTFTFASAAGATSHTAMIHPGDTGPLFVTNITGNSFGLSSDLPAGEFTWYVRANDATGGQWSTGQTFTTTGSTSFTTPGTNTNDRTPTFAWTPVTGATNYVLQVDNLTTSTARVIFEQNLTSATYTPATNLPAGNYRAWVRAIGSTSNGPWTLPYDFTIALLDDSAEISEESQLIVLASIDLLADSEGPEVPESNPGDPTQSRQLSLRTVKTMDVNDESSLENDVAQELLPDSFADEFLDLLFCSPELPTS